MLRRHRWHSAATSLRTAAVLSALIFVGAVGSAQDQTTPGASRAEATSKGASASAARPAAAGPGTSGAANYAVCVSKETYATPDWRKVADALVEHRHAALVLFPRGDLDAARSLLASVAPRYAAFVAQPSECGRRFVVGVHRMTRKLDDDPYADCIWGIVTGYEAEDALRVVTAGGPLVVRRALAGTGLDPLAFVSGVAFSECKQGESFEVKDGALVTRACPSDATKSIVDALNAGTADAFVTSGHATEHDWQIGFSFTGGQFRCSEGRLFGVDVGGREHPIKSMNPKVYLAPGNCLIGHVDGKDCMVLAWMRSGGAVQMVGYTVSTWAGHAGWGTMDYWTASRGRLTLSEAFFASSAAIVFALQSDYPRTANADCDDYAIERDPDLLDRFAAAHGVTKQENLGLLWDRDTFAFYGDPAFEARLAPASAPPHDVRIERTAGPGRRVRFTLTVTAAVDAAPTRPVFARLPARIKDVELPSGERAVAPGDFVMWRISTPMKKGERRSLVVTGEPTSGGG